MKGKRGCRFGCFHIEMTRDDAGKSKVKCHKGWPRVQKASFSRLQYDTQDLMQLEEFKNENPHVFQAQRDHPFEGMSNPVAQVVMRCNVDVKYLGRAFAEDDLDKFCNGSFSAGIAVDASTTESSMATAEVAADRSGCVAASSGDIGMMPSDVSAQSTLSAGASNSAIQDSSAKRPRTMSSGNEEEPKLRRMKQALERVLIDMSRDMQDVGFYTGEYAAKKFELARSMLPELCAGAVDCIFFGFIFVICLLRTMFEAMGAIPLACRIRNV